MWYSWTSPQRPSWGQRKLAVVESSGLNKSQCMDCPSKKAAVVERWSLVEVRLYNTRIEIWTTLYRSFIATSVDYCIMLLALISPLLCKRQRKEARPSRGVPSYSLKFYLCCTLYQTSVHLCRPLIGHVRGESKPERPNVPQQLFQRLPVAPSSR